jgi:hypothetical protein
MTAGVARIDEANELEFLRADVRYRRERRDLYRARLYAGRPASTARLAELARLHDFATARLRRRELDLDQLRPSNQRKRDNHEQAESL